MPFRLLFWPSHYFLLFSQERLKNHPKTVLKHISQHSSTKCANVISQEVGLQGRRDNGTIWGAEKGQWKITKTNRL